MIHYIQRILMLLSFMFSLAAYGQQEATLQFMTSLPQVSYNNPAFFPQYRFSLGLPGSSVAAGYFNNGFSYRDFTRKQADSIVSNPNSLFKLLGKDRNINTDVNVDLFRLSLKMGARSYFTWNITTKSINQVYIPQNMMGIFEGGNVAFTGSKSLFAPSIESMSYIESGWSLAYRINKDFTIGWRFKLIKGLMNATTNNPSISLTLDPLAGKISSHVTLDARSSGVHSVLDSAGYDVLAHWEDYLNNTGYGGDIGMTYRVKDRLTLALSVIDIGKINWKHDVYEYTIDPATANYTFQAIDLTRILNGDNTYLTAKLDSIGNNFKIQKAPSKTGYSNWLPAKMYLSGNFEIKQHFTLGGMFFARYYKNQFIPGGSVSLHKDFGRRMSGSISYTVTQRTYNNIGLGFSISAAPLQFYIVGDNVLMPALAYLKSPTVQSIMNDTKYVNVRAGINFVFGWDKLQERQPYPIIKRKTNSVSSR